MKREGVQKSYPHVAHDEKHPGLTTAQSARLETWSSSGQGLTIAGVRLEAKRSRPSRFEGLAL